MVIVSQHVLENVNHHVLENVCLLSQVNGNFVVGISSVEEIYLHFFGEIYHHFFVGIGSFSVEGTRRIFYQEN
jgi:hypothetical protein